MPGATKRNGTNAAVVAQRRAEAVELALAGLSYAQIAEQVGYRDRSAAYRAVSAVLREHVPENVAELRLIEGARLEALHAAYWQQALEGDTRAVDVVLRVADKRCRLFGLDAPQRVEAVVTSELDSEIESLIAELTSRSQHAAPE